MGFNYQSFNLPVATIVSQVQKKLSEDNTLIVKAPTGAGKSTLLPLTLLNQKWLNGKKIIMLEPRRMAARAIAQRMANMINEPLGQTVGYRIRFESKIGPATRLEVVTEGILTRILQKDNSLEDYAMVIFDEFHERSIHADLALALCRQAQEILRDDLRLMIMSATIDMPMLAKLLKSEVVESEGRLFPVEVKYVGDTDQQTIVEQTIHTVLRAVKENTGDVLVFLPGQREIQLCEKSLEKKLKHVEIHALFGMLNDSKQLAAIFPSKSGKRKIVLATNIAETSLTIEGIKIVVDSGFERRSIFNPKTAMSKLVTVPISKESADQRKGRAGRLSEGICYRMWSKASQYKKPISALPEIEEVDLSNLLLELMKWGIKDIIQLAWLNPPPAKNLYQATQLLEDIGAINNNQITNHGKLLHQLPTHPRIAHMLIKAKELGKEYLSLATDIAPFFEQKDPLAGEVGADFNKRIIALRRFRRDKIGSKKLIYIEKLAYQYRELFSIEEENGYYDEDHTGLLIAFAYPERIACARPGNNAQYQLANGQIAMIGHKDDLGDQTWLAVASVNERESGIGKIFMASALNPQDLAPLVKEKESIRWDGKNGELKASKELRIGNIILQSKPIQNPDSLLLSKAIHEAIAKDGNHLLNWNDEAIQLLHRVQSLVAWNGKQNWPDFDQNSLIYNNREWLAPYIQEVRKAEDLKKLNIAQILFYSLSPNQREQLETLAPQKIKVPSGSQIKLNYQAKGAPVILAVKLQECFGLLQSPSVNNGQQKILMHLLSPGYKMVQITDDLASFWNNTYFEIRKELRIKYKKHKWPENPLEAIAERK